MQATISYRLRDVRVAYETRCVLHIPSLDVPAGRITAVVGPNGSGKSTLLRVLALLQPPTSGTIELFGARVAQRGGELTAQRRQATYVAQAPLLFRGSVRANTAYGLRARGAPVDGRVDAALTAVGLHALADRSAHRLSGGEAQRVAIARALAIDPPILLFDEPTANIDRAAVPMIEALLLSLGAAGKTVVLSTHNLDQAYRLGHDVLALRGGRMTPSPLVNVLHGRLSRRDGRTFFDSGGLRIELADDLELDTIAVDADDIIISRAPLESSARNCFPGQVTRIARGERGIVLTIDCGVPLLARITPHSYDMLGLNLGAPVYVTFKASAIHAVD